MGKEAEAANRKEARNLLEDERNRTRAGFVAGQAGPEQQDPPNTQLQFQPPPPPRPNMYRMLVAQAATEPANRPLRPPSPMDFDVPEENPVGSGLRQPAGMSMSATEVANLIRQNLPEMADFPDWFLAAQPIDVINRAVREKQTAELSKPGKKLEMRLHANFSKARENPVTIKEGLDNRSNILHEGRYLAGAGVKLTDHWLNGRRVWGEHGVDPIGNYDTQTMGMSGCVTARGWDCLHRPGSDELSLKLFSVSNVGHAGTGMKTVSITGEDGFTVQESWKELSDMQEVKTALKNMRRAAHLVRPWDFSIEVLESFLSANNFMEAELSSFKKAPLVAGFIDHVLQLNASQYVQEKEFLEFPQLQALWVSWWGVRKSTAVKGEPAQQNKQGSGNGNGNNNNNQKQDFKSQRGSKRGGFSGRGRGGQGGQKNWDSWGNRGGQYPIPDYTSAPNEYNICRRYNEGNCLRTSNNCTRMSPNGPVRMYHRCNFKKEEGGKSVLCKGFHPRMEEHK